ncbi:MAG TPA: hypothetical protein VMD53_02425 [Rhizomicrobium sp.]|nr:hypothetical protein [Rhizomicrobium sp.]
MRASACFFALGLLALPLARSAHAEALDDNARTECKGTRCVGSYCDQDGDALNCWQESVYQRKAGEEVHWVCAKRHHKCSWIRGPIPDSDDKWNVIRLETD